MGLTPTHPGWGTDLAGVLVFADEYGGMDEKGIAVTKRRLKDWWKSSRENRRTYE